MISMIGDTWYRYRGYKEAIGGEIRLRVSLKCEEYKVFKETDKTVLIGMTETVDVHRVSKTARKRFAYPTKELALTSFIKRKQRHQRHLEFEIMAVSDLRKLATDLAIKMQQPEGVI